jgi:uncharacterized membrane protein YciS (DUF1049 family)
VPVKPRVAATIAVTISAGFVIVLVLNGVFLLLVRVPVTAGFSRRHQDARQIRMDS